MQCPACRAVYSNGLDQCPRCKTPASPTSSALETELPAVQPEEAAPVSADSLVAADSSEPAQVSVVASTLIEFPGARSMPQWRKQLSERVREIQERRSRESVRDMEEAAQRHAAQAVAEPSAPPLGLVPPPEVPEMNPIVVAALRRIERARQPQSLPPMSRSRRGGAAAARVAEEHYQEEIDALTAPLLQTGLASETLPAEAPREHNLIVVPSAPPAVKEETVGKPKHGRAVEGVVDDETLAQREQAAETDIFKDEYDDRAPVASRVAACLIDMLVVIFASSPFAAIIELTNGDWSNPRVAGSMGAIVLVVMFLYFTASTSLAGRTWGMSLLSLRAVDADTGLLPTTRQSVARTLLYIISLAAFGLGLIYALFDAEGRTAHDHLSSTAVVRE